MIPLTQACEDRVDYLFPAEEDRVEIKLLLISDCGDNLPLYGGPNVKPGDYDRIRFAVLKLSGGRIADFHHALEIAKIDWRDSLVAAGFGHQVKIHEQWLAQEISP